MRRAIHAGAIRTRALWRAAQVAAAARIEIFTMLVGEAARLQGTVNVDGDAVDHPTGHRMHITQIHM